MNDKQSVKNKEVHTITITKDLLDFKTYTKQDKYMLALVILMGVGAVGLIIYQLTNDEIWSVESTTIEKLNNRQNSRGILTSMVTSIFSVTVSTIMLVGAKSNAATYQALVSIICLGLVGFILDNSFATENGVGILLNGIDGDSDNITPKTFTSSLKYAFGSLLTPKTLRYFIVSMLDIFISLILTDSIVWGLTEKLEIHESLANIVSMVLVAVVTFLAYSNATRLEWAYPATETIHTRSELISTPTVLIATVIAGMVYMVWKPRVGTPAGITKPEGKLVMIMITFFLIIICYYGEYLDPVINEEIKQNVVNCPPTSGNINGKCVVNEVVINDVTTVKDQYDNGILGVILFLVLCTICTFYVIGPKNYNTKNITLAITCIGIMLIPGIFALGG